jgi:hypothetical protein
MKVSPLAGKLPEPGMLVNLHRTGRYDRMSDDVLTLTGQPPLTVREFVQTNPAAFTASAKAAT